MNVSNKIFAQYKEWGLSKDELGEFNQYFSVPVQGLLPSRSSIRIEAITEAISWPKGDDQDSRIQKILYQLHDSFSIAVAKPGKEAAPEYRECRFYTGERKGEPTNNPNDMNPQILLLGNKIEKDYTFDDMFEMIEEIMRTDIYSIEILAMILFRAAFMIDHKKNREGNWRYYPIDFGIQELMKRVPSVKKIPLDVLIHFLEVVSLNEDVKVYTLGYNTMKQGYGRVNTLLTFVNLIGVLLHRVSLSKFASNFARYPRGMAPIAYTQIGQYFPLTSSDWQEFCEE